MYCRLYNPLQNPVWAFSFNARVPVVNLSTSKRRLILYASSHVGVLYDFEHNSQRLLQGHVRYFHSAL